ncbi:MAG: HAD-IC family P-type ATPase [Chloroflexota bacterium]
MTNTQTIEVPVRGMDCHECTQHVQHAIAALPGVASVAVFLTSEKAVVQLDPQRVNLSAALAQVRPLGITRIELLTGDNERTAATLARIGCAVSRNLLPEDKIAIVKAYQAQGHSVVMVGDGVNDAPALGAAGSDIAIQAAHVALMRDDWTLVPDAFRVARRTLRVVRMNIAFTVVYNVVGLTLAALGFLPPVFAAAAQSLPDLGILANSARLLRQK